jgi:hypothetical protein
MHNEKVVSFSLLSHLRNYATSFDETWCVCVCVCGGGGRSILKLLDAFNVGSYRSVTIPILCETCIEMYKDCVKFYVMI